MASSARQTKTIYADFRADFAANPVTLDLALNANEEAVKESIRNLILTERGERLYQPSIGSGIRAMLFEPLTAATLILMRQMIEETIRNHEPRARLIDVQVTGGLDGHSVEATIVFGTINIERPVTLEVSLRRIR